MDYIKLFLLGKDKRKGEKERKMKVKGGRDGKQQNNN